MEEVMVWRSLALCLALSLVAAKYAELPAWRGAGGLASLEPEDERRDAELLAAVQDSMHQWEVKRTRTRSKRSQSSVCYDELGCFEDAGPFAYLETLPSPPREIDTHFLLYSTISRGDQPLLAVSASNMSAAWEWAARAFDAARPTRVIVHGFGSNCDNVWVYEMRSALMAVEECNVVCVDWEGGAVMPNYLRAAANTRLVGKQLALLLNGLAKNINLKFQDVHLIGFSLGAHVAGFAGSEVGNISRITGLDPAGPLFEFQDSRARLDSGDAHFVDVIHSNGENLILGGLGAAQPLGHVDFYPNGGRMQHGCSNLFLGAVSDLVLPSWAAPSPVEGRSLCNHRRAYKFFTDSVSPKCHFPAFPCTNYDDFLEGHCFPCGGSRRCGNMGYYADRSLGRGQLFLLTREEEPFCAHQYHVSVWSGGSGGSAPGKAGGTSYGKLFLTLHGDSGLNESFPMTKKDDTALTKGIRIARMVVPHPALGVPVRITLRYTASTGWFSSGARSHIVDKLLIADSFGKKSSFCKKGLELVSEESVDLPLYPGDCVLPDEEPENNLIKVTKSDTTSPAPVAAENPHQNEVSQDASSPAFSILDAASILDLSWTGEDQAQDSGRAFGVVNLKPMSNGVSEIAEPVLRPRLQKSPRRSSESLREISEPLLRATPSPGSRKTSASSASRRPKHYDTEKDKGETASATLQVMSYGERPENENGGFVVQFLPTRLALFISRAERYARDTLLPLVSAYAPRLPIFGPRDSNKPEFRYIPTETIESNASTAPNPTLESKIGMLKNIGPPGPPEVPVDSSENSQVSDRVLGIDRIREIEKVSVADTITKNLKLEKPIEIPTSTSTTTLPPVAVRGGDAERLLIVYPSNAREDRKIRSHSYSEIAQFEALYRRTASPREVRVELPTYRPQIVVTPVTSSPPLLAPIPSADNRFKPVAYSDLLTSEVIPVNSTKV